MFKKLSNLRYRDKFMFFGVTIVLLSLFTSDPDFGILSSLPFGGSTLAGLILFSKSILAMAFAHFGRKAYFDYPEGDFQSAAAKAKTTATGAGLLCLAYAVVLFGLMLIWK